MLFCVLNVPCFTPLRKCCPIFFPQCGALISWAELQSYHRQQFPQLFKRKPRKTHTVTSKNFKEGLFYKRIRISCVQVGKIFYVPKRFLGVTSSPPLVDSFSRIILNISEGHMTQKNNSKPFERL